MSYYAQRRRYDGQILSRATEYLVTTRGDIDNSRCWMPFEIKIERPLVVDGKRIPPNWKPGQPLACIKLDTA